MAITLRLTNRFGVARTADRERDRGNWAAAAALYANVLARRGRRLKTFGYIVQLGNCLKEAGRLEEALAAYEDAARIDPRNSDLQLQRGHLFKLMGNTPASAWAYQRAYNLDRDNACARFAIEESGAHAAPTELPEAPETLKTIWFDVTDFVDYARSNISLSGIQRVCGNLMRSVAELALTGYRVVPVLPDYDSCCFFSVRYDSFVRLVRLFDQLEVDRDELTNGVIGVVASRSPALPGVSDIFVIAGAFWIVSRYDMVDELHRRGTKFGLFIHDLIPLRNPRYAMPDAADRFAVQLSAATERCDFVLTNSRYVRDDVRAFLRDTKHRDVPVHDVPLPTELIYRPPRSFRTAFNDPALEWVASHEYVLVVSTIEVRKNHALAIRVWEQLREELGDKTPHLVFVGKWGWEVDALRAYIDDRGYEGDWLFIFNGVSDTAMSSFYTSALFTVYPSFAEGFGLPIGESLAHGKPCIASGTTAMPEVGGDFVRYFDPFDWASALPVIRQPIVDRDDLRRWQERIAADFSPRRWIDFCEDFYRSAIACAEAAPDHTTAPIGERTATYDPAFSAV